MRSSPVPRTAAQQRVVAEAEVQRQRDRDEREDEETDQPRRDERQPLEQVASFVSNVCHSEGLGDAGSRVRCARSRPGLSSSHVTIGAPWCSRDGMQLERTASEASALWSAGPHPASPGGRGGWLRVTMVLGETVPPLPPGEAGEGRRGMNGLAMQNVLREQYVNATKNKNFFSIFFFLKTYCSFAEDLYLYCQANDIDFAELRVALNTKWNVDILEPRDGIGGHCLPKDTKMFLQSSQSSGKSKI